MCNLFTFSRVQILSPYVNSLCLLRPQSTHTQPIAPKAQALSYLAPPFSLIVPRSLQPPPLLPWPFFLIYLLSFLQQCLPCHKRRCLFFQVLTLSSKITPLDPPLPPLATLSQGSALSTAPPTAPPVPCCCSPGPAHSESSPGPRYISLLPPRLRGQLPHELGRVSSFCCPWSGVGPHAEGGEAATAAHTLTWGQRDGRPLHSLVLAVEQGRQLP